MVLEEAGMGILTDYITATFVWRDEDVNNKRLYASPAIPYSARNPSAAACWVHAFERTARRRHLKRVLVYELVPDTREGYPIQGVLQPSPEVPATAEREPSPQQEADTPGSSARPAQQPSQQEAEIPGSSARPVQKPSQHQQGDSAAGQPATPRSGQQGAAPIFNLNARWPHGHAAAAERPSLPRPAKRTPKVGCALLDLMHPHIFSVTPSYTLAPKLLSSQV